MQTFALIAGVTVALGALMVVLWFFPHHRDPAAPPKKRRKPISKATKQRAVVGVLLGLALAILFSFPMLVFIVPAAFIGIPLLQPRQDTSQRELTQALAAWARTLSATAETGSFTLREVVEVSQGSTPPLLRAGVDRMVLRMNASWSTADALRAFAEDLDNPEADEIVLYLVQATSFQSSGVADALKSVADALARQAVLRIETYKEREKPRRIMRTMTIIFGSVVALVVLAAATPQYASIKSPIGATIMVGILGIFVLIMIWGRSIIRTVPEPRLLSSVEVEEKAL